MDQYKSYFKYVKNGGGWAGGEDLGNFWAMSKRKTLFNRPGVAGAVL